MPLQAAKRRRVAAYARVSTDSDEQYTSYEAQIDYYTNYIRNHEGWDFAGIYADEGISGTSTKRRDGHCSSLRFVPADRKPGQTLPVRAQGIQ